MNELTVGQKQAYEWAKKQDYQSVAAQYAKQLAEAVDILLDLLDKAKDKGRLRETNYEYISCLCPVCNGRGREPNKYTSAYSNCHLCNGHGALWTKRAESDVKNG